MCLLLRATENKKDCNYATSNKLFAFGQNIVSY